MNCIICDAKSEYYFSKTYSTPPFDQFMRDIGSVDYHKCTRCGFVLSKTHCELSESQWNTLNCQFHHYHETAGTDNTVNQPPYAEQAMMLIFLGRNEIIQTDSMLDYAAGYGSLSKILSKYNDLSLPIYDPYVQENSSIDYIDKKELQTYKTVINSAMFEHILGRDALDQLNNLVAPDGCLIIHTVICENVPKDPHWFYLQPPVHTAFHTNKSMEILMKQWNYRSSIYSPKSKCWVLLRDNIDSVEKKIERINRDLQAKWFYCKNGFVDYWKGF